MIPSSARSLVQSVGLCGSLLPIHGDAPDQRGDRLLWGVHNFWVGDESKSDIHLGKNAGLYLFVFTALILERQFAHGPLDLSARELQYELDRHRRCISRHGNEDQEWRRDSPSGQMRPGFARSFFFRPSPLVHLCDPLAQNIDQSFER